MTAGKTKAKKNLSLLSQKWYIPLLLANHALNLKKYVGKEKLCPTK